MVCHALRRAIFTLPTLVLLSACIAQADFRESTEKADIVVHTLAEGLDHPWSVTFLPDGRFLVTERAGRLRYVDKNGLDPKPITGLPRIAVAGQGGLLDVALHPDFVNNHWVYFSYAGPGEDGSGTEVARGKLEGHELKEVRTLFRLNPKTYSGHHFGGRLVFDREGRLYITLGDRGDRPRAQRLSDHAGSSIRLNDDGTVPTDNPFVNESGAKPEIFTYGNRNMQGAALNPWTGEVWTHEHGPQGGDEVNVMRAGVNYGWPVITYGVNYGSGTKIGEGTEKPGMAQPLYYWVPSIAPSGMAFYDSGRFPQWRGNLFVGSLKFRLLVRLELDGEKVTHEERMLEGKLGRIRDVRAGPDGNLYLLTDEYDGRLVRVSPAE